MARFDSGTVLIAVVLIAALVLLLTACGSLIRPQPSATPAPSSTGRCHEAYGLPDPRCTPGDTSPAVTQADIGRTICTPGYTATVRPPASYTSALKAQQIRAYGYASRSLKLYEEDHLIPLELGGSSLSARNLWPEPRAGANGAAVKDRVENAARRAVCHLPKTAHPLTYYPLISLAKARQGMATDWISLGRYLKVIP